MQWQQKYLMNNESMDQTHKEFIELVEQLNSAKGEAFIALFHSLKAHTKAHFDMEQQWMEGSKFTSIAEHKDDHQRILGELNQMEKRLRPATLPLVKAWASERLPQWFDLHVATMDSALAAHLALTHQ